MDTNKKILFGAIGAAIVIGGAAIGFVLSQTPEKADLSTIHTEAASEAPKETMAPSSAPETTAAETASQTSEASSVSASIKTYTSGKITIEYPAVDKMEDSTKQEQVNDLLKSNALSIIRVNGIDESKDSLAVKCKVVSVDRKRITAVYTGTLFSEGAAYPPNLFYTNTVNLTQVQDLGLGDFTDAYTMAGYVLSDDVVFSDLDAEMQAQVLEYRSTLDIDTINKIFAEADFPLSSETEWPESFSYEKQGTIYFSLPVPHALGDYVIVSFDPSTK